jgi:hypothetical protein
MTNHPESRLQFWRPIVVLTLTLLLAACGPGGGGTGTGPQATYSVSGANVAPSGSGPVEAPPVGVSGVDGCSASELRIEERRIELAATCGTFVFSGEWTPVTNRSIYLPGMFTQTAAATAVPATLSLYFGSFEQVLVGVSDQTGQTLVEPRLLLTTGVPAGQ